MIQRGSFARCVSLNVRGAVSGCPRLSLAPSAKTSCPNSLRLLAFSSFPQGDEIGSQVREWVYVRPGSRMQPVLEKRLTLRGVIRASARPYRGATWDDHLPFLAPHSRGHTLPSSSRTWALLRAHVDCDPPTARTISRRPSTRLVRDPIIHHTTFLSSLVDTASWGGKTRARSTARNPHPRSAMILMKHRFVWRQSRTTEFVCGNKVRT